MNVPNKDPNSYPISSNSRSKLSAFRYNTIGGTSPEKASSKTTLNAAHQNKENEESWLNGVVKPGQSDVSKQQPVAEPIQPKPRTECPQTPGNRIPLADLIGNAEDALLRDPEPELTPEDYVIWQHVPPSSNPDSSQTPATKSRKRRHSSSPSSSPLAGNSKSARKESFDLNAFQAVLKTPQNDLAADLWNNYVGKVTENGTRDLPRPHFANLLSSSPHTPASARTGQDSSGLRRSISCNAEWPSAKPKRRRVDVGKPGTGRGIFGRSRSNVMDSGKMDTSKINQLVETIEKNLRGAHPHEPDVSPVPASKRSKSPVGDRDVQPSRACYAPASADPVDHQPHTAKMESSSDYGDDDFDQDFLDLAVASEDPFLETASVSNNQTKSILNEPTARSGTSGFGERLSLEVKQADTSQQQHKELGADEFDDDFDDFSDDIEDFLAACDATPSSRLPRSGSQTHLASGQSASGNTASALFAETTRPPQEAKNSDESSFDEFDDGDLDMEAIEQSMQNPGTDGSSHTMKGRRAIKRYLIVDIAESTYTSEKGRVQAEQVLLVQDERNKDKKVVVLRESWFDTPCSKDLYIHLIGDFDATGQCVVSDTHNMVILHPDHLVSATVVADSIGCQRRAVLQDRIKNSGDIGKPQVFGNIFHEIFQNALKLNQWDMETLRLLTESVAVKHIEELYLIRMSIPEAVAYVMGKIPAMKTWADLFLRSTPGAESLVEDRNSSKLRLSINKLLEVEEHVWSPMYGLKGNVDATVQVACHDEGTDKNLVVPLELKTGNRDTNHSHRAQTALYTLLLSDRYGRLDTLNESLWTLTSHEIPDLDVTFGLLYYVETSKIFRIRGIRHELLQMIHARNRLAGYMRERTQLPPMIKRSSMCNRCYSKTPCFIYHKLADNGDGETSGLGDDFVKSMDHLTSQHGDFFQKWDSLITKEELSMMRFKRELWTLLSSEREALGRCFGNIVIEPGSGYEDEEGTKINRYRYTFVKKQASPSFSFTESQLTVGEPIVISDEEGHFALSNGYITQVSPKRITVAVDRRLHNSRNRKPGFDPRTNQSFRGIMEIRDDSASSNHPLEPEDEVIYRLDKDEFSNGMAIVRSNLVAMMERDLFQANNLRRLIIEGEAPKFNPTTAPVEMSDADRQSLNIDQRQAIDKVMSARDYALVLGMPGTGKTTTISHIIRALVSQGKSVLLTSYTHTAVDNILLKIRDDNLRVLRIGATAKVHPEVQQFADLAATPKQTMEELKAAYEDSQVVATTCLGVNHHIFTQRVFDYCIVDEASQITLPVCLGPIRMARTFILVGDHYQLPPLVQNKEAQEGGLDISLFKLLSDSHPESVVNLEHQYRMCEDIMLLSATLIYSGRLRCGTPEVAARSLKLPNIGGLKQHHVERFPDMPDQRQLCLGTNQGRCWLRDLVEPSAKTRFVNTDTLISPARDVTNGSHIVNPTEATLCSQLVEAFISSGIPARSIGVITFYRSQLSLLKQNLRHHLPELEMHTADKFQGRDKEIVILSCVRSNSDNNVGDLLRDWRRVNVAFTRARTKLLVVGSKGTLRDGNDLLRKYIRLVEQRGWIYDLPKGALDDHIFESNSLLTQSHSPRKSSTSPKHSPPSGKKAAGRHPLSPLKDHQTPQGLRKPAKKGAKLISNGKVLGNRPVLQDVVNDLIG